MEMQNIKQSLLNKQQEDFFKRNLPKVIGSDGEIRNFDESRIRQSILNETSANTEIAKYVATEMKRMLLHSDHKTITAPYIREIACSILYDVDPQYRDEYTRLGMPYADFKDAYKDIFEDLSDWKKLTPQDVYELIIPKLNSMELIEMVYRLARDYIGVRNSIERHKQDEEK
jgi:transcriptional regulator NrdR family protein